MPGSQVVCGPVLPRKGYLCLFVLMTEVLEYLGKTVKVEKDMFSLVYHLRGSYLDPPSFPFLQLGR